MLPPIFEDDAPLDARQEAAAERLLGMCPEMLRITFRPIVRKQISAMSREQIDALMIDVDGVLTNVQNGAFDQVYATAKRWGATDDMIRAYAPGLQEMANPAANGVLTGQKAAENAEQT